MPVLAETTTSSVLVAAAAAAAGRWESGSVWRPINAISHIVWGPGAAKPTGFRPRYSLAGLALNYGACWFWAWFQRAAKRRLRLPDSPQAAAGLAAAVSAAAYITDYHLVPRRFTPGFELSLSSRHFPWLYGALALGLMLPALVGPAGRERRRR
jgi:hypothetical protein